MSNTKRNDGKSNFVDAQLDSSINDQKGEPNSKIHYPISSQHHVVMLKQPRRRSKSTEKPTQVNESPPSLPPTRSTEHLSNARLSGPERTSSSQAPALRELSLSAPLHFTAASLYTEDLDLSCPPRCYTGKLS